MNDGYLYYIKDPRKPEGANIVFVGLSNEPWLAVRRHLVRSQNPAMKTWARDLLNECPEGLDVPGKSVAERWHGEDIEIPDAPPGLTRVEWGILEYVEGIQHSHDGVILIGPGRKQFWIDKFVEEGHPILNRRVGRPRKQPIPES